MERNIIPRNVDDYASGQAKMEAEGEDVEHARELVLKVEGMWCPACSWLIEQVLGKTNGIVEARALFPTDTAMVKYLPQFLSPNEILANIEAL